MDCRPFVLKTALILAVAVVAPGLLSAQSASGEVDRLVVRVEATDSAEAGKHAARSSSGAGFIVGEEYQDAKTGEKKISLYVATAAHVIGGSTDEGGWREFTEIHAVFSDKKVEKNIKCSAEFNSMNSTVGNRVLVDLAILKCGPLDRRPHLSFDVLANRQDLKKGARLSVEGNYNDVKQLVAGGILGEISPVKGLQPASGKGRICEEPQVMFFFPVGTELNGYTAGGAAEDLHGFSGGPVLTDRSGLVGIDVDQNQRGADAHARRWCFVQKWVEQQVDDLKLNDQAAKHLKADLIRLRERATSAPALRTGSVEVAAESTSFFVPQFGWLTTVPKVRIATTFPGTSSVDLAFDFAFSQSTHTIGSGSESLSIVMPAITADYAIGSVLPHIRTKQWLGGIYVGSGVAPIFLEDTLRTYNVQSASVHSYAAVFDVGWRYRVPGKQWGVTASYREAILTGSAAQTLYPRIRSVSIGVFGLFH